MPCTQTQHSQCPPIYSQSTSHNSPIKYGVYFVSTKYHLCSILVIVMIYTTSCYNWTCYDEYWMYYTCYIFVYICMTCRVSLHHTLESQRKYIHTNKFNPFIVSCVLRSKASVQFFNLSFCTHFHVCCQLLLTIYFINHSGIWYILFNTNLISIGGK